MRKYRQRIHYTEADKALMWDPSTPSDVLYELGVTCTPLSNFAILTAETRSFPAS
jgi:hypothetical protein